MAAEAPTEFIEVPPVAAGDGEYVLRVRGDSMTGAGILDGDYIVVERAETATDGDLVVALINDAEATIKRYRRDADGAVWLEPANPDYEPIRDVEIKVVGLVVGLFRSIAPERKDPS